MSILKRTIPQLLILPAFVALQIVTRPLMLCVGGPCEIKRCEMSKVSQQELCVAVNTQPEPAGCCAIAEKKTTPSKMSPCGGCGDRDAMPTKTDFHCAIDDATDTECSPNGCDTPADQCPFAESKCSPCLPVQVLAEPSVKIATRLSYDHTLNFSGQASRALVEADHFRGFLHTHSPPIFKLARAGPQICITNCSWLI